MFAHVHPCLWMSNLVDDFQLVMNKALAMKDLPGVGAVKDRIILQGVPLPAGVRLAVEQFYSVRASSTESQARVCPTRIDPQVNLHQGVGHSEIAEQGRAAFQAQSRPAMPQRCSGGRVRKVQPVKAGQVVTVPVGHGSHILSLVHVSR